MPRRRARSLICRADSSPLTYRTRLPSRARLSQTCSSSVLLPMPGSPPIRISPPSTMPPPSTRSSSLMPVPVRRVVSSGISFRTMGTAPVPGRWFAAILPAVFSDTASRLSSSVFHPPQPGHLPTHRGVWYPQAVHSYTLFTFAIILTSICQTQVHYTTKGTGLSPRPR